MTEDYDVSTYPTVWCPACSSTMAIFHIHEITTGVKVIHLNCKCENSNAVVTITYNPHYVKSK